MKRTFWYIGPVTSFGKVIVEKWNVSTSAESEKKARSNLIYRYKRDHNLLPTAKIELPGKLY